MKTQPAFCHIEKIDKERTKMLSCNYRFYIIIMTLAKFFNGNPDNCNNQHNFYEINVKITAQPGIDRIRIYYIIVVIT